MGYAPLGYRTESNPFEYHAVCSDIHNGTEIWDAISTGAWAGQQQITESDWQVFYLQRSLLEMNWTNFTGVCRIAIGLREVGDDDDEVVFDRDGSTYEPYLRVLFNEPSTTTTTSSTTSTRGLKCAPLFNRSTV